MNIQLPLDAMELFNEGNTYALEDGKLFAYGLKSTATAVVQETCKQATESYAKEILNWPHGRLAKPTIFSPVNESPFEDLGDCFKHFVRQLRELFHSSPPKQLPIYPHAFIAVSKDELPNNAILVIAYESRGIWKLGYRSVPIQVELGQFVDSLRMGDESPEDILERYASGPAKTTSSDSDHQRTSEKVFTYCDNLGTTPESEEKGILVIQLKWDGNINKGDKELKSVGKTMKIHETRVVVMEALTKACEIAENLV